MIKHLNILYKILEIHIKGKYLKGWFILYLEDEKYKRLIKKMIFDII